MYCPLSRAQRGRECSASSSQDPPAPILARARLPSVGAAILSDADHLDQLQAVSWSQSVEVTGAMQDFVGPPRPGEPANIGTEHRPQKQLSRHSNPRISARACGCIGVGYRPSRSTRISNLVRGAKFTSSRGVPVASHRSREHRLEQEET
jgi:hypothetical protein